MKIQNVRNFLLSLTLILILLPSPQARGPFASSLDAISRGPATFGDTLQEGSSIASKVAGGCPKKGTLCSDLDITYIERTPRYYRYAVDYTFHPGDPWRIPRLCEGTENNKRWPDVGETVTYTAHILNKGTAASSQFRFVWLVNGAAVAQGTSRRLQPGAEQTFDYVSAFPASPEKIEFRVEPRGNPRKEASTNNNHLIIGSHDLTLSIWVEQGLYDVFNRELNLVGTRSFEDWIQAQFAWMNERFELSRYPVAPQGILDRVRIDKLVVAPDLDADFPLFVPAPVCTTYPADPDGFLIDGAWQFKDGDPTNAFGINGWYESYVNEPNGYVIPANAPRVLGIDTGLIHELAHQLGVIDLYRMNLDNRPELNYRFEVKDLNGQVIPASNLPTIAFCQLLFPYPGIMSGGDTSPYKDPNYFESHTAGGLNSNFHKRRGYFGEYLFDTPDTTILRLFDSAGNPLANADVRLYQKDAITEVFDDMPEIRGTTDVDGRIQLTNREVIVPITTATGHTLRANPFGQIFHEGSNGTMFVKVTQNNQEFYGWLLILDLNLAYWSGHRDTAEITIVVVPPSPHQC
jgi:CARDB